MPSNKRRGKFSPIKPGTKVATVIAMAKRKRGVTAEQIAKRLKISRPASYSLIDDARRYKGVKIKLADGVYRVA
jgi:DNA-binding transcriptional regulator LsrR (DeoR family)